jgi:ABC-type multidrug transport system fused ATPase/permease subunit
MKASGSSERVFHLIDRIPKIRYKGGLLLPSKIKGEVIMENIHFSYPSRPDVEVLKGLNLKLAPGTITALVGKSGGGKSTIVSLLEGFYYPTKGKILLDGIDIQNIDPHDLHKHIGIVSQEPILFGTTIANNISYGNHNVSINKIIEVSKLSNSHSFISSFPEGYNTIVGERGIRLSGGQKQRIAIARALLIDPTLLLLDEATSALDSESEFLVREALERLMKGRTVLIIAHRLSTVKNADLVCVVENGKIIEQGTHSQLLFNPSGIYAKLVKRQLQID